MVQSAKDNTMVGHQVFTQESHFASLNISWYTSESEVFF